MEECDLNLDCKYSVTLLIGAMVGYSVIGYRITMYAIKLTKDRCKSQGLDLELYLELE